jgi:RNA polymerase sigma-70 factor, ECF subfamily
MRAGNFPGPVIFPRRIIAMTGLMQQKKSTGTGTSTKTRAGRPVTNADNVNPVEEARSTPPAPDDYTELVRLAATGDGDALERLLLRAQEVAWRFSTAVCGHADDAEDAMQEALIKTYRYVGRIREPAAFKPWLYRTVRNACLMGRRKRGGEPVRLRSLDETAPGDGRGLPMEPREPGKNPEQLADNARLRRQLRTALQTLPGPYRGVLFLREMEGLSTRDVASVLEISEDSVKTRLHRARVQLQMTLNGGRK